MSLLARPTVALVLLACVLTACTGAGVVDAGSASAQASAPSALASRSEIPLPTTSPHATVPPDASASTSPIVPSEGFATTRLTLSDGDGRIELTAWIADTRPLRRRGLMQRTSLPADAGMLFVFDGPTHSGFWMKNTLIPLSIAFFDEEGRLLETLDMPPCEADPCPLYSPGVAYRYALEVNRGFYAQRGITADWRLDIGGALGAS